MSKQAKKKRILPLVFFLLSLVILAGLFLKFSPRWQEYAQQRQLTEDNRRAKIMLSAWQRQKDGLPDFLLRELPVAKDARLRPFYRLRYRLTRRLVACRQALATAAKMAELTLAEKTVTRRGERRHVFTFAAGTGLPLVEIEVIEITAPVVSLVIDDLGYDRGQAFRKLLELSFPLSVSVIPGLRYSEEAARRADQAGHEVIVHMPMETVDGRLLLSGSVRLMAEMSAVEIKEQFRLAFKQVPMARGMNNHQGSRVTADERMMGLVLKELKARGCFFLDSRTTKYTVCATLAKKTGLPFAERSVFLDNQDYLDAIEQQLVKLEKKALAGKNPVGLGHLRGNTVEALARFVPRMQAKGIRLVFVSEVLNY